MDYKEQEAVQKLNSIIKLFQRKQELSERKEWDGDIQWGATYLFSKILLRANRNTCYFSREELENFKSLFEQKNNTSIDLNLLFSNYWLREILGFIHLPDAVRVVTNDFEKYQSNFTELSFLRYLYKKYPNQQITESELQDDISKYQLKCESIVDQEWLKSSHWIKKQKTGDELKIGNVDYLFTLMDSWEVFAFLNALKKEIYKKSESVLIISKTDFNSILHNHKKAFPNTPSLNFFKENGIVASFNKNYKVYLYNAEINYWESINDKVCALIWETLLSDKTFTNNEERLKSLISIILRGNRWPNITRLLSKQGKSAFLVSAVKLVSNEKDIIGVKDEFAKCFLEDRTSSRYAFISSNKLQKEPLNELANPLDFFNQLYHLSSKYQGNLFYEQDSRKSLAFLIKEIILGDEYVTQIPDNDKVKTAYYQSIVKLYESSNKKPFLNWELSHFIIQYRPTVLLYLLTVKDFSSLAIHLLDNVKIETSENDLNFSIKLKILKESLMLALSSRLRLVDVPKEENAKFIFQIYIEINKYKFDSVSNVRSIEGRQKILDNNKHRENTLLEVIENCPLHGQYVNQNPSEYLLNHLLDNVLDVIEIYKPMNIRDNGTIQFPIFKIDALCWLSNYIIKRIPAIDSKQIKLKNKLSSLFKKIYFEIIDLEVINRKEFNTDKIIEAIPVWGERNERLSKLDWVFPMLIMNDTGDIDEFLNPHFRFKTAKDEYDNSNHFQGKKVRSHLYILLSSLKQINTKEIKYGLESTKIKSLKVAIEQRVVNLVKQYGTVGKAHKTNVISERFDRQLYNGKEDQLLPFIIEIGNYFENKNILFEKLIKTTNVVQLLIILEGVKTKGIRDQIIVKLKKIDIIEFLRKQNWRPEILIVVTKLALHNELIEQAQIAQDYWQKNLSISKIDSDSEKAIFESKLIMAYQQKDKSAIQKVEEPSPGYKIHNEFKPTHHKQFFIALIDFDENPEKSYDIFKLLGSIYPKDSTIALNRFAAKINWALKNNEGKRFSEALQEWTMFENSMPQVKLELIIDKINYNKLTAHLYLKQFEAFEDLYRQVQRPYRMTIDLLELRVQMLLEKDLKEEAGVLLKEAKEYHSYLGSEDFTVVNELFQKVSKNNDVEEIKKSIEELATRPKHSLEEYITREFQGGDFGKKMTKEIAEAAERILTKIKAIDSIKDEDRYNDLLQIALESKLSAYGFHIKDQSRGAYSASGKGLGERDLVIYKQSKEISVIEPFIHTGKSVVQSHITKLFNYSHQRDNMFVVIYDFKLFKNLNSRWNYYFNKTIPSLKYPENFEINSQKSIDLTNEFNYKNSAIKIGVTTHSEDIKIYHIMINLNYKID